MFKEYPGDPVAASEFRKEFIDSTQRDESDLRSLEKLRGCNLFSFFGTAKKLIASGDALKLRPKERAEIGRAILERINQQLSPMPNLMQLLIADELVDRMIQAGYVTVSDPVFVALLDLDDQTEALHKKVMDSSMGMKWTTYDKMSSKERSVAYESVTTELSETGRLGSKLSKLLSRARLQ